MKGPIQQGWKTFPTAKETKCSLRRQSDSFPISQCLQTKVENSAPSALSVAKAGTASAAREHSPWISLCVYSSGTDPSTSHTPGKHPAPDADMLDEPFSSQIWSFNLTVSVCSNLMKY